MTVEKKIVVGLDDIKAVVFECRKCQTRVSVKADNLQVPYKCPRCNEQWQPDFLESATAPKFSAGRFCSALAQCRTVQDNGAPFTILLEFEAPHFENGNGE